MVVTSKTERGARGERGNKMGEKGVSWEGPFPPNRWRAPQNIVNRWWALQNIVLLLARGSKRGARHNKVGGRGNTWEAPLITHRWWGQVPCPKIGGGHPKT